MSIPSEPGADERRPGRAEQQGHGPDEAGGLREQDEFIGSEEVESGMTERLTFFSDAVVAIAMTLLVLELPVPEGLSAAEFWNAAKENWNEYLAFLIGWFVIAAYWSNHHRLFRFIARVDNRLRTINLAWLFAIVVLPFFTKMISAEGDWGPGGSSPSRFALYAAVQVLASGTMAVLIFHARSAGLFRADTPRSLALISYWRSGTIAVGFLLSIPFFFFWDKAWLLWIALPIVFGVSGRAVFGTIRRERGRGRRGARRTPGRQS